MSRAPRVEPRHAVGIDAVQYRLAKRRIEPARSIAGERGIDRKPLGELHARGLGCSLHHPQVRPRRFGIDVVRRDRRNPAPVVDPGSDHPAQRTGTEIGRRLDVHVRLEDQTRHGDGPEMVLDLRRCDLLHARAGLGPEILDDDFLDMTVRVVQVAQRKQRVDALLARFADADQNPRRERHAALAGQTHGFEARGGNLVGRAEMGAAFLTKAIRDALQHDPLRHRDLAQSVDVLARHQAGIDMGEQSGLAKHRACGFRKIG